MQWAVQLKWLAISSMIIVIFKSNKYCPVLAICYAQSDSDYLFLSVYSNLPRNLTLFCGMSEQCVYKWVVHCLQERAACTVLTPSARMNEKCTALAARQEQSCSHCLTTRYQLLKLHCCHHQTPTFMAWYLKLWQLGMSPLPGGITCHPWSLWSHMAYEFP